MKEREILEEIDRKLNRGRHWKYVIPMSEIKEIYDATRETFVDVLRKKGRLVVRDVGTFETVIRSEKVGTHPRTGKKIVIPPRKGIRFKPHKKLAGAVEKKPGKSKPLESTVV
jgi:nucleoid DNA-binding protein